MAGVIVARAVLAPAIAAGAASASPASPASAKQVTVAITSVSPQIARPGQRVTVSGTISNPTGNTVSG
ncbi:MAG TPA: hypothetical protein VG123_17850, partial [Streptosporangiaceae bacterium]|nr:hypothetical protein [Streptosporangiaceae bacterium]